MFKPELFGLTKIKIQSYAKNNIAFNRPTSETTTDSKVRNFAYNKAGLLEQVSFDNTAYITDINYNEKGQRTDVYFGNSSKTRYYYDADTFRLTRLLTTRNTGQDVLQDLNYTYDPEGNIVQQTDLAQQTFYYSNTVVAPTGKYEYDALYRLIKAEGRELEGLAMPTATDFVNNIPLPNTTPNAMRNYTQLFTYDKLGNMLQMQNQGQWTRNYVYDTATNRLLRHESGNPVYTYDSHGNMLTMPHLPSLQWDFADRLHVVTLDANNNKAYYAYNSGGERTRKIVVKGNTTEERIYFGDYEIYRKTVNQQLNFERHTHHVNDDTKKVALTEYKTIENGLTLQVPEVTIRYQYDNHLGSASLELDETAQLITYEEYHPFGTTSYRAGRSLTETSLKRYKYVGKERDEETGLYYYGMRYYADWLCRFVSVDPLQFKYPHYTPFQYAGNKPITFIDLDGMEPAETDKKWGKSFLFTNENIAKASLNETDNKQWLIESVMNLNDISKKMDEYIEKGAKPNVVFISSHGYNNRLALAGPNINTDILPTSDTTISPEIITEYMNYKQLLSIGDTESLQKIEELLGEQGSDERFNKEENFKALELLEGIASKIETGGALIFGSCLSGSNARHEEKLLVDSFGQLFNNRINIIMYTGSLRAEGSYLNTFIETEDVPIWIIRRTSGEITFKKQMSLILSKNKDENPILWKRRQ